MSIVGKIFSVITLILVIVAGYLSYVVFNKRTEDTNTITQKETQIQQAQAEVKKKSDEVESALKEVEQKTSEVQAATERAQKAQKELDDAQKKVSDLQSQVTNKDDEIKKIQAEFDTYKQQFDGLSPEQLQAEKQNYENQIQMLTEEKEVLSKGLEKAKADLAELMEKEERRRTGVMPMGTRGKVVSFNADWNFVVIDIGDKQKVVEGVQMLLYRGNVLLGRVKIRTVERNSSVADIVAVTDAAMQGAGPRKVLDIQPGDIVIF
ncbi:hypothetical protein QPK87_11510 [Kamptonema cortianum]|nr:hypothetical protein [Oscillatoria laete-virens]MDK3157201.1 hypothetical protein [Kamptonema cortianum]MDL5054451.1 hypothetical protein [Oscillatoria laete-virens NRMC-F 0139]